MLLLTCPVCAITADQTEFTCGGPCESGTPYTRGPAHEYWCCTNGCGSWFGMTRNASNQTVVAVWSPADEPDAGERA